ncbi:MAG: hypothetical protein M3442_18090, partial [Chloroflexota bacterium]|nr:hypothetical protein [Chloroflexota bacterium]
LVAALVVQLFITPLAATPAVAQSLEVAPAPSAAVGAQGSLEEPILDAAGTLLGRHYRQTGDGATLGFDVRAPFFDRLIGLGGPSVTGYPVSIPFRASDGCDYQALQVVLLQQCAGQDVRLANSFEIMQDAGVDAQLEQAGIGPATPDASATFEEAVRTRMGWMEDAAIRERFLTQCGAGDAAAAIALCGLPMNRPSTFGPFVSQRFQRIAFQRWLTEGPAGIKTGDVTAVLAGDLLKDTGILIGLTIRPHPFGRPPDPPTLRLAAPGSVGAPATSPAAPAITPPGLSGGVRTTPLAYGFQGDFHQAALRRQSVPLVTNSGFGWVKQQIVWANFEMTPTDCRQQGPNCLETSVNGSTKYFWRNQLVDLQALLDDMQGSKLNVLISVVRAPAFYAAPQGVAPADPAKLRDFLQFLVSYPPLKGKISAIEPWNEQNLSWEWGSARLWPNAPAAPPQGVVEFVQLQKAAYQGIKAGDAAVTVVLPALTPTGVGECWRNPAARNERFCLDAVRLAIDDRLYLEFLYGVNNAEIKQYYDAVGVHPSGYNNPPDDFIDRNTLLPTSPAFGRYKGHGSFYIKRYQELREVQERFGDTKPMWLTEVGWSSTRRAVPGYEFGQDVTEEQRGRYTARMLDQLNTEAPYISHVFIWNLNFRSLWPESDERYGFGVVDPNGAPLPAYICATDFVRSGGRTTLAECRL